MEADAWLTFLVVVLIVNAHWDTEEPLVRKKIPVGPILVVMEGFARKLVEASPVTALWDSKDLLARKSINVVLIRASMVAIVERL